MGNKFIESQINAECGAAEKEEAASKSALSDLLVLQVLWRNEDELPEITDEEYNYIYPGSKVDMVRVFPYVMINGKEYYLRMKN